MVVATSTYDHSCSKVRIAERSIEGRHAVVNKIQRRAPHSSVGYQSSEMRFKLLQNLSATQPGCLKDLFSCLDGLERTHGLQKAVMSPGTIYALYLSIL